MWGGVSLGTVGPELQALLVFCSGQSHGSLEGLRPWTRRVGGAFLTDGLGQSLG